MEAAGMLSAAYKLKLARRNGKSRNTQVTQERKYRYHEQEFRKISRQINHIHDPDADMENLKNGIDMLVDDV